MAGEVVFLRRRSCRKRGSGAGEEDRELCGGRERERRTVVNARVKGEAEAEVEEEKNMKK